MQEHAVNTLRGFDSYEIKLGDELRGERASLGKSLLDVQRELKIKAAYIDAIENCDVSVFPNRGYIAGYVRAYARYLRLDAADIYARFCAESGFEGVNAELTRSSDRQRKTTAASGASSLPDEILRKSRFQAPASFGISLDSLSGLGSVAVLVALVVGLGYGALYLLNDIQRIGFEPVPQTPVVSAPPVLPATPASQSADLAALTPAPDRDLALVDMYAPRLKAPSIEPRDGPIASIDPDKYGVFAPAVAPATSDPQTRVPGPTAIARRTVPAGESVETAPAVPTVPPVVSVVAGSDAWIRVYQPDGTVIFERILGPGESYQVPGTVEQPLLRAGNAGAIYLRVGSRVFGPIGEGSSIARAIPLDANNIAASWPQAANLPRALQDVLQSAGLPVSER